MPVGRALLARRALESVLCPVWRLFTKELDNKEKNDKDAKERFAQTIDDLVVVPDKGRRQRRNGNHQEDNGI